MLFREIYHHFPKKSTPYGNVIQTSLQEKYDLNPEKRAFFCILKLRRHFRGQDIRCH